MSRQQIEITELGARGDGIGQFDGKPVYAEGTVPGDVIETNLWPAGKQGLKASSIKLLKESDRRQTPPCQHFGKCGGCSLQHVADDYYQQWMQERLRKVFSQQGIDDVTVLPAIMSPAQSRRRINLKALRIKDKVVLGYHQRQSHQLVDLKECPVAHPSLVALIAPLRECLAKVLDNRQQSEVYLTKVSNGVEIMLSMPKEPGLETRLTLTDFANTHDVSAISLIVDGLQEVVIERRPPTVNIAGVGVAIPPAAFLQATEEGEASMIKAVMEALPSKLPKKAKAIDLFAGVGTFSFALAQRLNVTAAEGALDAINALKYAANQMGNKIKPIDAIHRDLFRRPMFKHELEAFDVAVIDPPRSGAEAQMEQLAISSVPLIIAISCNPNTFARDAKMLLDKGYKMTAVQPIGQFLWSSHIELVTVFSK